MADLKLYSRISKSKLKNLLNHIKTKTEYIEIEDKSACDNCSINNLLLFDEEKIKEKEMFCKEQCTKRKTKLEPVYHAIDNETPIGIVDVICNKIKRYTLSKTCLKQYLFYHFIPANNSFVRKSVSFAYIAKSCKISIPTARENHKKLVQAGLVYSTKNKNLMDLVIDGEYGLYDWDLDAQKSEDKSVIDFLDESQNPTKDKKNKKNAYATISLQLFNKLLNIKELNALKVELKKLEWSDASTGMKEKNNIKISLNKDNLVESLPSYIKKSKNKLDRVINHKKSNFKLNGLILDTTKFKRPSQIREDISNKLTKNIEKLFTKHNQPYSANYATKQDQLNSLLEGPAGKLPFIHPEIERLATELELESQLIVNDFICLSSQFGIRKTMNAIKTMFKEHSYINDTTKTIHTDIKIPGAYIRSLIISSINKTGSVQI